MPRVAGVDPGTISIDVCGLEDGELCLDHSIPTATALADLIAAADAVAAIRARTGRAEPDVIT